MDQLAEIKQLIYQGKVEEAISMLHLLLDAEDTASDADDVLQKATAYYLRGNAYRKLSNWQLALNDYQRAIDLDSTSPALQARRMVIDILNFYNKDMYNQ